MVDFTRFSDKTYQKNKIFKFLEKRFLSPNNIPQECLFLLVSSRYSNLAREGHTFCPKFIDFSPKLTFIAQAFKWQSGDPLHFPQLLGNFENPEIP